MSDYNNNQGFELGWDSAIENDSPDYIILPDRKSTPSELQSHC